MYQTIKFLHILSAVIALGFNLSYMVWMLRGQRQVEQLHFALRGIKLLDDWFANPAYILTLMTGLGMVYLGGYNLLDTAWLSYSLGLFGLMGLVGFGLYTPALARELRALERHGHGSEQYRRAAQRQRFIGMLLVGMALSVLLLMVIKPF